MKNKNMALPNQTLTGLTCNINDVLADCGAIIQLQLTRTTFLRSNRTTERLEHAYNNISEPMTPTNPNKYFVTFIDNYSRYGHIIL